MGLTAIPFLFMRGGTSRGPYFNRADLPPDRDTLAAVLLDAIGAGHPQNIDGIGGGVAVTTKVAMLSPADHDWADIDYFFAQVAVDAAMVDFAPSCGNILAGVGPAAIEMGLIAARDGETPVRIRNTNTGALTEAIIQTPGGVVDYQGTARIDGVPGTAAPIRLTFMDVIGSKTGALFPTGTPREVIDGIEVTCIDVAVPMVIARPDGFGLTGHEAPAVLDANRDFHARMESIRIEAGRRMGLGDVTRSVTPKVGLLAPKAGAGDVCARYFMPWSCHPSMAVTGAQCLASCVLAPGTVAEGLVPTPAATPAVLTIEHGAGVIDVTVDFAVTAAGFQLTSAGILRTARKLAAGELFVPARTAPPGDRTG